MRDAQGCADAPCVTVYPLRTGSYNRVQYPTICVGDRLSLHLLRSEPFTFRWGWEAPRAEELEPTAPPGLPGEIVIPIQYGTSGSAPPWHWVRSPVSRQWAFAPGYAGGLPLTLGVDLRNMVRRHGQAAYVMIYRGAMP